jgi:hypothetical protein
MAQPHPSLPTNRAFVVQFRAQPTDPALSWEGRVEHLSSGQVLRFHSPEELLTFLACKLKEVLESPCAMYIVSILGTVCACAVNLLL